MKKKNKKPVLKFRSIILSDVHLGTLDCKAEEVCTFLKHTRAEKLILNGDIIDGWSLKRKGGWNKQHTRFVRHVLKKAEKKNTEVVYLRGNHDDFLAGFLPVAFDNLKVVEDYVHESAAGKRYLCVHGDVFDAVTTHSKFIAVLGDIGYQTLLRINRFYNRYRQWRGKEFFSLSKLIKARVKRAVSHISNFENHLEELARKHECDGVICGHIHTPEDKYIGSTHYLNSGDWVESLTAIVEHYDGTFEILDYQEFSRRLREMVNPSTEPANVLSIADANAATRREEDVAWVLEEELEEAEITA